MGGNIVADDIAVSEPNSGEKDECHLTGQTQIVRRILTRVPMAVDRLMCA